MANGGSKWMVHYVVNITLHNPFHFDSNLCVTVPRPFCEFVKKTVYSKCCKCWVARGNQRCFLPLNTYACDNCPHTTSPPHSQIWHRNTWHGVATHWLGSKGTSSSSLHLCSKCPLSGTPAFIAFSLSSRKMSNIWVVRTVFMN